MTLTLSHVPPLTELAPSDACSPEPASSQPVSAQLLTSEQLVKHLFTSSNASDRGHIASAIEQLTKWAVENGMPPKHESLLVAREVGEADIAPERLAPLVAQVRRRRFVYEWVLPRYTSNAAGFRLVDSVPEQATYRGGHHGGR